MNYSIKKRAFAVVFLLFLLVFGTANIVMNASDIGEEIAESFTDDEPLSQEVEEVMQQQLAGRIGFVETYGEVQRLQDKNEYNDFSYIKDENGFLNYSSFYSEDDRMLFESAGRVKKLQDYVGEYGTKVLVVVTPSKYSKEYSEYKKGAPINDPHTYMNELIVYLDRLGIEVLNLDELMPNENISYDELFYKTDHHWTSTGAFEATKIINETIKDKFGEDLDPTGYYLGPDSYTKELYKGHMLGSMGRGTGVAYSGIEDFEAYFPNFEGNYKRHTIDEQGMETENSGNFVETLYDMSVLEDDIDYYKVSQYALYMDEIRPVEEVVNLDNPDGPSIAMIRDSYMAPVIPFLAPMCSRIDAVWSLENLDELEISDYIRDKYDEGICYDYFIIEVYPYNLDEQAFRFFRGDK